MADQRNDSGGRTFRLFGFDIRAEFNLNTLLSIFTLIAMIGGGAAVTYKAVSIPMETAREVADLQTIIGKPGSGNYLPGMVKRHEREIASIKDAMKVNHDENLRAIEGVNQNIILLSNKEDERFNRLDQRIDNWVASSAPYRHLH